MNTRTFLGKLFNVRSGEWSRLALLYCMSLVFLTGANWSDAIIQAAFLQLVGVQYLPWVFISSAACSIGALFIYTAFADRVSNTRLLIAILAVGCAGTLLGLAILAAGLLAPAFLLLYLVNNVPLTDLYNVHWPTYVNSFYDIRVAKRIVPVLGSAARVAGIVAGLSMPLVNRLFSPPLIIALGMFAVVIMALLAVATPRILGEPRAKGSASPGQAARSPAAGRLPRLVSEGAPALTQPPSRDALAEPGDGGRSRVRRLTGMYGANLRESLRHIQGSPFLRWMALATLCMTVFLALVNYQASTIFQVELKTTVQISNFVGVLTGIANLVVLPIQLLLLSRLITRLGLANVSLIYPLTSLATAGSVVVAPGLATAALAYLDRTALRTAFRNPTDNLLYNAVPLRVKARTRAFVSGLIIPIGTIVGGLILLTPLTRTSWFLPAALVALALAFTLAALLVRQQYAPALVALLEQGDYSSLALQVPSLQAPSALPPADAATLSRLTLKLRASTSSEQAVFLARLIAEIGGEAAVPIIGQAARATSDGRLRASLVDVLAAAEARGQDARALYAELLADPDGRVRLAAVGGLEQTAGPRDSGYLEIATRTLADPEIAVRLRVLPALLVADDPGCRAKASTQMQAMLNAPDPQVRAWALQIVAQTRTSALLPEVLRALAEAVDEVRLAAALAAESLAEAELRQEDRDALLVSMMALLRDPGERARLAAITVLGRLSRGAGRDATAAREGLAAALADSSPHVREGAIEALACAGQPAVPHVFEQLTDADAQARKMAAVVLARIEPRKYAPLVLGPNLIGNLRAIYRQVGCSEALAGCPGPTVTLLRQALRERNTALLDEVFYLLAAVHDAASVRSIAQSLRSRQPETRANAAEALESLTSPQTGALVAPLFDPDLQPAQLLALARRTWDMPVPSAAMALRLLLSKADDGWLRTLAAAALAELIASGGSLSQAEIALLLGLAGADLDAGVRAELAGEELSLVEKLLLVKAVPFFRGMTTDQLRLLAAMCEQEHFDEGAHVFDEGDAGGAFYIVVRGRIAIEQCTRRATRVGIATIDAGSYFGDSNLFHSSPRSTSAVALQDVLTIRLRRDSLMELAGRYPDISLELIDVLAQRLREANDQVAELARSRPRQLHRLFDSLEEAGSPS